jgi:hypothetical protein
MKTVNLLFSGGRTSANLVEDLLYQYQQGGFHEEYKFVITYANTGREHNKTLEFVNHCDLRWQEIYDNKVVWLEAVVHQGRLPCGHKVVDFKTADREGNIFAEMVAKYGLPNGTFLHCTRELKENPIMSYMESLGERKGHIVNGELVKATYETWIGIRADEPRRLKGNRSGKQEKRYPLGDGDINGMDFTCSKQDVLDFWEDMPFDLQIPEHQGNCVDCHKKSNKKLALVYKETPKVFNFTAYLDNQYSEVKAQVLDGNLIPRKRFRGYKNTKELIASFDLSDHNPKDYSEESGGCSESCEAFMDSNEPESETIL